MKLDEALMEPHIFQRNIGREVKYTLALVLAGGRGRRLKDLTKWRVKPAVHFGGKFRIIDFTLSNCLNSGIRKIGVLTQYKSQSLIRHILNGWGLLHPELGEFIEILPAQQRIAEEWYQGTADAIYQNIDIIRRYNPECVLILAGDHVYKMDYGPMISYHHKRKADLTIGCLEKPIKDANAFGVIKIDEQYRITSFFEKPNNPVPIDGDENHALVSMGIYVFSSKFLYDQLIQDADNSESDHDFGKNIIPDVINTSSVYAYPFHDYETGQPLYWRDVGTVDSYWKANMELISVVPELNLYEEDWPIRSSPRQYPPAKFVFNDDGKRGMAVDSMISSGSIISGAHVEESLLFTNVHIEVGSKIEQSVILPDVVIGPDCRIKKAVVDKRCEIAAGTVIGEDREEDEERFYVSPGGVVLVAPDMLGQVIHRVR